MPFTISNPPSVTATSLQIDVADVSLANSRMNIMGKINFNDDTTKAFQVVLQDGEDSTEFTDFYTAWTTTEQLYALVTTKLNLSGSYSGEGEAQ